MSPETVEKKTKEIAIYVRTKRIYVNQVLSKHFI